MFCIRFGTRVFDGSVVLFCCIHHGPKTAASLRLINAHEFLRYVLDAAFLKGNEPVLFPIKIDGGIALYGLDDERRVRRRNELHAGKGSA